MARFFGPHWSAASRVEAVALSAIAVLTTVRLAVGEGPDIPLSAVPPAIPLSAAAACAVVVVALDRLMSRGKGAAAAASVAIVLWSIAAGFWANRLILHPPDWIPFPLGLASGVAAWALSMLAHRRVLRANDEDNAGAATDDSEAAERERQDKERHARTPRRFDDAVVRLVRKERDATQDEARRRYRRRFFQRLTLFRRRTKAPLAPRLAKALFALCAVLAFLYRGEIAHILGSGGAGEARAARGPDGRYVFNARINGTDLPMIFDNDVEAVTLRAEDAVRLGVSLDRLDFAGSIKSGKIARGNSSF